MAGLDVQLRLGVKSDCSEYYEHVLWCSYDYLVVSENAEIILINKSRRTFNSKKSRLDYLRSILVVLLGNLVLDNLVKACVFSSLQCAKATINNAEIYLKEQGLKQMKKAETPVQISYKP